MRLLGVEITPQRLRSNVREVSESLGYCKAPAQCKIKISFENQECNLSSCTNACQSLYLPLLAALVQYFKCECSSS
jgi:hypothetical protein